MDRERERGEGGRIEDRGGRKSEREKERGGDGERAREKVSKGERETYNMTVIPSQSTYH